jgi:cation diffusion facilitator CzcD-associated flavoprotein CzcO
MHTLRTPKNLPGPNWGIPNLSFRRWFEAQNGGCSWDDLRFILKEDWADYLDWYRDVMELPVEYSTEVTDIRWDAGRKLMKVTAVGPSGAAEEVHCRRVVLATGIEGSGEWTVPDFIKNTLPKEVWAHTNEPIDFASLKGKRVGVLGAGASAFDNASVCLETGAAEVDLCFRRKELVRVNTFRWAEFMEFLKHFPDLDDQRKWQYMWKINDIGQLPPHDTYHRALGHENFHLRPETPWEKVEWKDGEIQVSSGSRILKYDYVIAATGFRTDLDLRPELKDAAQHIKRWGDFFQPAPGFESADLSRHPYLGASFAFEPRGDQPWVRNIFNFTYGAILNHGFSGASITGMKYSLQRVVQGLTASFYEDDKDYHYQSLCDYDEEEF